MDKKSAEEKRKRLASEARSRTQYGHENDNRKKSLAMTKDKPVKASSGSNTAVKPRGAKPQTATNLKRGKGESNAEYYHRQRLYAENSGDQATVDKIYKKMGKSARAGEVPNVEKNPWTHAVRAMATDQDPIGKMYNSPLVQGAGDLVIGAKMYEGGSALVGKALGGLKGAGAGMARSLQGMGRSGKPEVKVESPAQAKAAPSPKKNVTPKAKPAAPKAEAAPQAQQIADKVNKAAGKPPSGRAANKTKVTVKDASGKTETATAANKRNLKVVGDSTNRVHSTWKPYKDKLADTKGAKSKTVEKPAPQAAPQAAKPKVAKQKPESAEKKPPRPKKEKPAFELPENASEHYKTWAATRGSKKGTPENMAGRQAWRNMSKDEQAHWETGHGRQAPVEKAESKAAAKVEEAAKPKRGRPKNNAPRPEPDKPATPQTSLRAARGKEPIAEDKAEEATAPPSKISKFAGEHREMHKAVAARDSAAAAAIHKQMSPESLASFKKLYTNEAGKVSKPYDPSHYQ